MKICIVGLGYVGLPAACVLAQAGHEVVGVEIRREVMEGLNQGQIHIDEPRLHDLVQEALAHGRFRAQTAPEAADAFILCVPTPLQTGYQSDLSYVEPAARSVQPVLKQGDLVVVESTIPMGATERASQLYRSSSRCTVAKTMASGAENALASSSLQTSNHSATPRPMTPP